MNIHLGGINKYAAKVGCPVFLFPDPYLPISPRAMASNIPLRKLIDSGAE